MAWSFIILVFVIILDVIIDRAYDTGLLKNSG